MKTIMYSTSILFLTLFLRISVNAQAIMDFETGTVYADYSDVHIPTYKSI